VLIGPFLLQVCNNGLQKCHLNELAKKVSKQPVVVCCVLEGHCKFKVKTDSEKGALRGLWLFQASFYIHMCKLQAEPSLKQDKSGQEPLAVVHYPHLSLL
jgi:hypothetical protein